MPLRDFKCPNGHITERLLKMSDDRTQVDCQSCAEPANLMISLIAFTPMRYGDCTGTYGVNGFHDRGLGATYHNSMEREALMKAKGLVTWDEAGGDEGFRQSKQNVLTSNAKIQAYDTAFDTALVDGAGVVKAHDLGKAAQDTVNLTVDN